nr:Wzt carbohydrate-binding domain-containing protein [Pseudomonadota bacterium]
VSHSTLNETQHATVAHGEHVTVSMLVRLHPSIRHPGIIFDVMDGRGLQLTGRRIALPAVSTVADVVMTIAFNACFQQGIYRIRTRVIDSPNPEQTTVLSRQEGTLSFEIVDDCREHFTGLFPVPMAIEIQP